MEYLPIWIPLDPYKDENPFGPKAPVKKPDNPKEK